MRVLVTGIAGDIGLSICKILKKEKNIKFLLGCDVHDQHIGNIFCDKFTIMPKVKAKDYSNKLIEIINKYKINIIIPSFESEQKYLNKKFPNRKINAAKIILANNESLLTGFDKFKTYKFLKKNKLPYPWTVPIERGHPKNLPCILKSRFSSGGANVELIKEIKNINSYKKLFSKHVWQQYIDDSENEYTCGVYRSSKGDIKTIIFKRRLALGISMYAEIVDNLSIRILCETVAKKLNLIGSINIQLRLSDGIPLIFEINPRFSSTVIFRDMVGFKDLLWSISDTHGKNLNKFDEKKSLGKKIYKYFEEKII